jgi:hypothetical protein
VAQANKSDMHAAVAVRSKICLDDFIGYC